LLAQRRLLHVQAHGGAGEVPFLGDHDEIAEVAKFHANAVLRSVHPAYGRAEMPMG